MSTEEDKFNFQDRGSYWLSLDEQRSEQWSKIRKHRLNASEFASMVGDTPYSTPKETAKIINGYEEKKFDEASKKHMQRGTDLEPFVRKLAEEKLSEILNAEIQIRETGVMIPKWDPTIGASLDGEVWYKKDDEWKPTKINIEIKCPERMPRLLEEKMGFKVAQKETEGYEHIYKSHYYQMMGGMAITKRKYCFYVVYTKSDDGKDILYTEFIPFNQQVWDEIYEKIKEFQKRYIKYTPINPGDYL